MRSPLRSSAARLVIRGWRWWLYVLLRLRLMRYQRAQEALARRYGVEGCEPEPYGETTRARIQKLAATYREPVEFAWTSGTTHDPKQILYPKRRLRALQQTYLAQAILAYRHAGLGRPAFYFLTSMAPDRSVSGLLARESLPWWLARYILCDSIVYVPAVARLVDRYSQDALHLTLLLLSTPVLIAMANPSSLYLILDHAQRDWDRVRTQVAHILAEGWWPAFRRRMGSAVHSREVRTRQLLQSSTCPSMRELLPALRMVYCWNGGYVQPFIDNLQQQLKDIDPLFRPMFSMSTETVAYLVYPDVSTDGGLPVYPGVCYEFIQADHDAAARNLLKPWKLHVGQRYLMVVSDAYGLKRYQTNDVFECVGFKRQTPLLRFQGRAGLSYSFTGEKMTDHQLLEAYETIRRKARLPGAAFTCFPKLNKGRVPGYVFVHVTNTPLAQADSVTADVFDQALIEINEEYASKRKSGRLAKPEIVTQNYEQLVSKLMRSDPRYTGTSPAQFKPLPLYRVFWESLPG